MTARAHGTLEAPAPTQAGSSGVLRTPVTV